MTAFKRATINIIRQPIKSVILLVLVFILGTVLSGAISVRNAIINTEEILMMQMPAVSTLLFDTQAASEVNETFGQEQISQPTVEEMLAIGNLSYVKAYDIVLHPIFFSRELLWSEMDIDEEELPIGESLASISWAFQGARTRGAEIELFRGNGVSNPDITDIEAGLINLVDGRAFTQEEIDNDEMVVIISQSFATTNNLFIGSTIELENIAHNYDIMSSEGTGNFEMDRHYNHFILDQRLLEFEVIGIFDATNEFVYGDHYGWRFSASLAEYSSLYNRIYMPIGVAEDMMNFVTVTLDSFEITPTGMGTNESQWLNTIYVLHNPRYLESFREASSLLLPEFWGSGDVSVAFAPVVNSMDTMLQIADLIQWVTTGATIAVLTLIITLFLRDRRHEVGVYMALGDKKRRIMIQILIEIILVTSIGIAFALFIGNILSDGISRQMFEQQLTEQIQDIGNVADLIPWELTLFNPSSMSSEETMEMYDVSLSFGTVITFVSISISVVLVSTIVPMWYLVKLEPKRLLM